MTASLTCFPGNRGQRPDRSGPQPAGPEPDALRAHREPGWCAAPWPFAPTPVHQRPRACGPCSFHRQRPSENTRRRIRRKNTMRRFQSVRQPAPAAAPLFEFRIISADDGAHASGEIENARSSGFFTPRWAISNILRQRICARLIRSHRQVRARRPFLQNFCLLPCRRAHIRTSVPLRPLRPFPFPEPGPHPTSPCQRTGLIGEPTRQFSPPEKSHGST